MDSIPGWKVAGASLFLAAATGAILLRARRIPWLAAGWLWYLGMLVPVIGVVQVGNQAMADRYTYLPLVGIFVAFAWGGAALAASLRIPPRASGLLAVALLAALAGRSWDQGRHWRDSTTLFLHALEVTGDSWVDRGIQGEKALDAGRYDEAVGHYRSLIRIEPFGIETRNNLGVALLRSGRVDEAVEVLEEAARMDPGVAGVRLNLGLALERKGRADEAAAQFREALRLDPGNRAAISRLRALGRDPGGRRPAIPGANPPSRW
jgi:tetratricopeptide (TPR) repeat protein